MKKLISILVLIAMLTAVFTSCNITPSTEPEENPSQSSTNNDSTNDDSTNNDTSDTDNNINNDNDNDNVNTPPPTLTTEEKYNKAGSLIAEEKYTEAYELLYEIKTYEPAKEKLKNFFYAPQTVDNIKYKYDKSGNITEMIDYDGTTYTFFYNENGNIISGRDLVIGMYHNSYTYNEDGKLYQLNQTDGYEPSTTTYYYNQDGLISKTVYERGTYLSESIYEYTFYENGNIKIMRWVDQDGYGYEYTYNENGELIKVLGVGDDFVLILTYGEYGLAKIDLQTTFGYMANFVYTYNAKGILIKLDVNEYYSGILEDTGTITFKDHKLCYSENSSTRDRLAMVYYTDIDAALDIIW